MSNLPIIEKGKTYLVTIDGSFSEKQIKDFLTHWEKVTGTKAVIMHAFDIIAELKNGVQ